VRGAASASRHGLLCLWGWRRVVRVTHLARHQAEGRDTRQLKRVLELWWTASGTVRERKLRLQLAVTANARLRIGFALRRWMEDTGRTTAGEEGTQTEIDDTSEDALTRATESFTMETQTDRQPTSPAGMQTDESERPLQESSPIGVQTMVVPDQTGAQAHVQEHLDNINSKMRNAEDALDQAKRLLEEQRRRRPPSSSGLHDGHNHDEGRGLTPALLAAPTHVPLFAPHLSPDPTPALSPEYPVFSPPMDLDPIRYSPLPASRPTSALPNVSPPRVFDAGDAFHSGGAPPLTEADPLRPIMQHTGPAPRVWRDVPDAGEDAGPEQLVDRWLEIARRMREIDAASETSVDPAYAYQPLDSKS